MLKGVFYGQYVYLKKGVYVIFCVYIIMRRIDGMKGIRQDSVQG